MRGGRAKEGRSEQRDGAGAVERGSKDEERGDGEEKPRHACASSITPTSSKITVAPRKTTSGGASNACVARGDACALR